MRTLIFLCCAAAGLGTLLWAAGGLDGPRMRRPTPHVDQAPGSRPSGTALPLKGPAQDGGALRLDDLEGPRYAMPESRVFHDPVSGERVEIAHFLPWTFAARAGRAVPGSAAQGAILFEDVIVRTFREPETLAEARRLRDDPRAIDDFVRLELLAQRARADGIAGYLDGERKGRAGAGDMTILLDGDVRVHDRTLGVLARGGSVSFDPRTHRAVGAGPFTVVHEAWSLEGEDFVLTRSPGASEDRRSQSFRVEVSRRVFLSVDQALDDAEGRPLWDDPAAFRPARVFAGRATVSHDGAGPKAPLNIVLESGVRALQQGGRRLLADRLALTLDPRERRAEAARPTPAGGWRLGHLAAEGRPVTIEVPDLATPGGRSGAGQISALRLRHEPSTLGAPTTVLEGHPVILFEGDLRLAGGTDPGRWLRASAANRAVLAPTPAVARLPDGTPVAGRRLELRGAARLERRGETAAATAEFEDVLEGDEITLILRPGERPGTELPVSFAALGHVRLSGTRLEGSAERLVVEGLDGLSPVLVIEGQATRLALIGFERDQRLFGPERPAAEAGPGPDAEAAAPRRSWMLDRLEATGVVRGTTSLGGPSVGVAAWLEADRAVYDRVTDRAVLHGPTGEPARVHVDAGGGLRHGLVAPTLSFERAQARVAAEGGVEAEIHLGASSTSMPAGASLAPTTPTGRLKTLALDTDGRIEVRLRLAVAAGDPEPDAPQTLDVLAPFTAELTSEQDGASDRLRAERLSIAFALRAATERARATVALARPAASGTNAEGPHARGSSDDEKGPPRRPTRLERWNLASSTLTLTLEEGELNTFDADGGTTLSGEALHLRAERLRFARRLGLLSVEGGPRTVTARLGPPDDESRLEARALQFSLDHGGPRWVSATGPLQAVVIQRHAQDPGKVERVELDCRGDVRVGHEELVTLAPTWVRRMERGAPGAAWSRPSEVWADRVTVRGANLLAMGRDAAGPRRNVRIVLAEGPKTTFRSGEGGDQVQMWCDRLEADLEAHRVVLTGAPGRDVSVHFANGNDVELSRASFDLRTGDVHDLHAGSIVLRGDR